MEGKEKQQNKIETIGKKVKGKWEVKKVRERKKGDKRGRREEVEEI